MPLTLIDTTTCRGMDTKQGTFRTILSEDVCGATKVTGNIRSMTDGQEFRVQVVNSQNLVFVTGGRGVIRFQGKAHAAIEGTGFYLEPSEQASIEARGNLELLHLVVPNFPIDAESATPGRGYFFDTRLLPSLRSDGPGRLRTFCVNTGLGITDSRSMQAGVMRYDPGACSPYHMHEGGADHFYLVFEGNGEVESEESTQPVGPGILVFIPSDEAHRLRASDTGLYYFEFQAPHQFHTRILSGDSEKDLRWIRVDTGEVWTQS